MASAACEAQQWRDYRGTRLMQFPGSDSYFHATSKMAIDADGAPNAYHPQDKGLDAIGNAEYPNGNWRSILVLDPNNPAQPFRQPDGPFGGYFLAGTSLQDKTKALTDPARYLDARTVPYIVFPGSFYAIKGTGDYGDIVAAFHLTNRKSTSAIVGDGGPPNDDLGEISIGLAEALGGSNVNPRNGAGARKRHGADALRHGVAP
jgi:hypothetical protein